VFLDPDEDRHRDTGEELLAVQAPFRDGTAVRFRAFGSSRNLTYYPSGYTRDRNGTFTFCDQRGAAAARSLVLYRTGRLRASRRAADGGPLSCD
jgi:type IV fimbrial biogenesis protein FimT